MTIRRAGSSRRSPIAALRSPGELVLIGLLCAPPAAVGCVEDAPIARAFATDGGSAPDASATLDAAADGAVDAMAPRADGAPPPAFACSPAEMDPVVDCAGARCRGASGADLTTCVVTRCASALLSVNGECRECIGSGIGRSVDEMRALCAGP